MQGRDYKPNYAGGYFHEYNRGVKKEPIFLDDQDYQNFIFRAKVLLGVVPPPKRKSYGSIRLSVLPVGMVEVLSYCLMPNHFHFLIKQRDIDGLKLFFHRLCTSYSSYFNKKYERVGHLFQDVFKCKNILEDSYLAHVSSYIHLNPSKPFLWRYSSLPVYMGTAADTFVNSKLIMDMFGRSPDVYRDFMQKKFDPGLLTSAGLSID